MILIVCSAHWDLQFVCGSLSTSSLILRQLRDSELVTGNRAWFRLTTRMVARDSIGRSCNSTPDECSLQGREIPLKCTLAFVQLVNSTAVQKYTTGSANKSCSKM